MRLIKDLRDWLRLRRHVEGAWGVVRSRKVPLPGPHCEVRMRDGGSVRLRTGTDDRQVFNDIFARDEYELDAFRPGELGTVIDIGAHVGLFAVRAAPLARRVVSYEPFPESYELLAENVRRFPHVTPQRLAVAERRGTANLFTAGTVSRHSLFSSWTERPEAPPVPVDTLSLADIFEEHRIDACDLLKIDCEGGEYAILLGAPVELLRRVRRVAVEYHPLPGAAEGWSASGLAARLAEAGHVTRQRSRSRHRGLGVLFSSQSSQAVL